MTDAERKAEKEAGGFKEMEIKYKRIWAEIVHEVNTALGYETAHVGIGIAGREHPLTFVAVTVKDKLEYIISYVENQKRGSDGMLNAQIFGDKITPEILSGIQNKLNNI